MNCKHLKKLNLNFKIYGLEIYSLYFVCVCVPISVVKELQRIRTKLTIKCAFGQNIGRYK